MKIQEVLAYFKEELVWYLFSVPLTSSWKLGDLKQQKLIVSQFWKLERQIKCQQSHVPSETLEGTLPCLFLASGGGYRPQCSLANGCFTLVSASVGTGILPAFLCLPMAFLLMKTLVILG